jgi:hypothetical protein
MSDKKIIRFVVPEPEPEFADKELSGLVFISPEGADPNREVPGFFIIHINGEPIWPGDGRRPSEDDDKPTMPRQFLSLDAVHGFLRETYGWKAPLRVTTYTRISESGPRDFPAIWGADRRIGRKRAQIRVRYLGSFLYWDGRRVDPTKVGTSREFN